MKHRKPRRPDWRKMPARRRLHPWINVNLHINALTGAATANGVKVVKLRMYESLDLKEHLCVDDAGNVYYDKFDFGKFFNSSSGLRMKDSALLRAL